MNKRVLQDDIYKIMISVFVVVQFDLWYNFVLNQYKMF